MNTNTKKYTARKHVVHVYLSTVHEMNTTVSTTMSRNMDTDVYIYICVNMFMFENTDMVLKKDIARAQKVAVARSNSYFNALRKH